MNRFDVSAGLAWGSGAAFVFVGAFNLLSGGIQLIGVGTILSTGVGLFKYYSDKREAMRRAINEMIVRLQPGVYTPLLIWSVGLSKTLENQPDVGFRDETNLPPDLSAYQDFRSIVGATMKSNLNSLRKTVDHHETLRRKLRTEYEDRVKSLVKKYKPDWEYNVVSLVFKRRNDGSLGGGWLTSVVSDYGLSHVKDMLRDTDLSLRNGNDTKADVQLPPEIFTAITRFDDLPSFSAFQSARDTLIKALVDFTSNLDGIGVKGERDWNLSLYSP